MRLILGNLLNLTATTLAKVVSMSQSQKIIQKEFPLPTVEQSE